MADSVGDGFPAKNINLGHTHYDIGNRILYVYGGGDPTNESNWTAVGGVGDVVSPVVQRFSWSLFGTEISVGFGAEIGDIAGAEKHFVAPSAGTLIKWGVIIGSIAIPEDAAMEIVHDPFGLFTIVDSVTIVATTVETVTERTISQAVALGDVFSAMHINFYNPANHHPRISGYIDFLPSA